VKSGISAPLVVGHLQCQSDRIHRRRIRIEAHVMFTVDFINHGFQKGDTLNN